MLQKIPKNRNKTNGVLFSVEWKLPIFFLSKQPEPPPPSNEHFFQSTDQLFFICYFTGFPSSSWHCCGPFPRQSSRYRALWRASPSGLDTPIRWVLRRWYASKSKWCVCLLRIRTTTTTTTTTATDFFRLILFLFFLLVFFVLRAERSYCCYTLWLTNSS